MDSKYTMTLFDIMYIDSDGVIKVSRRECFRFLKERKMKMSISRFTKEFEKEVRDTGGSSFNYGEIIDMIYKKLNREWIINELSGGEK